MSTDCYIDVFEPEEIIRHPRLPLDDLEDEVDGERAMSCDSLRIGHVTTLQGLSFNCQNWLQDYAFATNLLSSGVVEGVIDAIQHLRYLYTRARNCSPEWLKIRYGLCLCDIHVEDVVCHGELSEFLDRHRGKYWRIRVD